jgi:SAM-dependent methyltransferase
MTGAASRVHREQTAYDEHNLWEETRKLHNRFLHVFRCPNTTAGDKYFETTIAAMAPGSVVLDYGCYNGGLTERLLAFGPARVVGIDISAKGIAEAKARLGGRAEFRVMDAHAIDFDDATFDLIVGKAILHHLNYDQAIVEIKRVLKPGGHAVFIEPLRGNPAAKLFRMLTPRARTRDEQPLSRRQLLFADRTLGAGAHRFMNLFSVPCGMASTFLFTQADNPLTRLADHLDRVAAKVFLRYWMRSVVLVWENRASRPHPRPAGHVR